MYEKVDAIVADKSNSLTAKDAEVFKAHNHPTATKNEEGKEGCQCAICKKFWAKL